MKNQLTSFLLLFLLPLGVTAQSYTPLLEPGKTWDIYTVDFTDGFITLYEAGSRQFIDGDTLLNGQTYQVIKARSFFPLEAPVFYPPFGLRESQFIVGFMREDTLNQKVYSWIEEQEVLTYDFSLEAGDSLGLPFIGLGEDYKVVLDSIETIPLPNGESTRKFNFSSIDIESSFYIEGIGGIASLITPILYAFEFGIKIECVRQNNEIIYDTFQNYCDAVVSNREVLELPKLAYGPNPIHSKLELNFGQYLEGQLRLYNHLGQLLLSREVKAEESSIDFSEFPKGFYALEIHTLQGSLGLKLIRE